MEHCYCDCSTIPRGRHWFMPFSSMWAAHGFNPGSFSLPNHQYTIVSPGLIPQSVLASLPMGWMLFTFWLIWISTLYCRAWGFLPQAQQHKCHHWCFISVSLILFFSKWLLIFLKSTFIHLISLSVLSFLNVTLYFLYCFVYFEIFSFKTEGNLCSACL